LHHRTADGKRRGSPGHGGSVSNGPIRAWQEAPSAQQCLARSPASLRPFLQAARLAPATGLPASPRATRGRLATRRPRHARTRTRRTGSPPPHQLPPARCPNTRNCPFSACAEDRPIDLPQPTRSPTDVIMSLRLVALALAAAHLSAAASALTPEYAAIIPCPAQREVLTTTQNPSECSPAISRTAQSSRSKHSPRGIRSPPHVSKLALDSSRILKLHLFLRESQRSILMEPAQPHERRVLGLAPTQQRQARAVDQ
jgi:hypothetical protein